MNTIHINHCIKEERNTQIVNFLKSKINATESLTINRNSTTIITNSSIPPKITITLLELRCTNTKKNKPNLLIEIPLDMIIKSKHLCVTMHKNNVVQVICNSKF